MPLHEDPAHARSMLLGLQWECPLGGNPDDCPLCSQRKLPIMERIHLVNGWSDEQCVGLYQKHLECLKRKTGE